MTNKEINDALNQASVLSENNDYPNAYYLLMDILERIIADDPYEKIRELEDHIKDTLYINSIRENND